MSIIFNTEEQTPLNTNTYKKKKESNRRTNYNNLELTNYSRDRLEDFLFLTTQNR